MNKSNYKHYEYMYNMVCNILLSTALQGHI